MTINIQIRQHLLSFSPFNSVRAAFLSLVCALCARMEPVFSRVLSRPFLIIILNLMGSEPSLMTSQQKCFAKFTDELMQNHPLPMFHWKNEIGFLVEYHSEFGGSTV